MSNFWIKCIIGAVVILMELYAVAGAIRTLRIKQSRWAFDERSSPFAFWLAVSFSFGIVAFTLVLVFLT